MSEGMVYGVEKIKHIIDRNAVVVKLTGAMVVEYDKHSM